MNLSRRNLIAAVAATTAVQVTNSRSASSQSLTPIVAGGVITVDAAPLWYEMQQGAFTKAGLDVNYQRVTSGSASMLGVVAGSYNVGNTNVLSVLQAKAKGIPIDAIAPTGIYNDTTTYSAVVVRADSPLRTASDLNGKTVGVPSVKDMNAMALSMWMDKNGGDSKSINFLELPISAMPAALEERRIDAATLLQPSLSQALASGKARIFANSYEAISKRFLMGLWVVNSAWAETNPAAVRSFVRVLIAGQIWANAHHAEAAAVAAPYLGVDAQTILKGGMVQWSQTLIRLQDIAPVIDAAYKFGAIDKRIEAIDVVSPAIRPLLQ